MIIDFHTHAWADTLAAAMLQGTRNSLPPRGHIGEGTMGRLTESICHEAGLDRTAGRCTPLILAAVVDEFELEAVRALGLRDDESYVLGGNAGRVLGLTA